MKQLFVMLLSLFFASSVFASSLPNCDESFPPRAAAITADHGFFFYVFPRDINASYSGCQTMWDEKGNVWFVLTFQLGSLTQYTEKSSENGRQPLNCQYRKEGLIPNSSNNCPEYGSIKNGFKTIDKHDEPLIPQGRDPRK